MVAILLATPSVDTGREQVPARTDAKPNVRPRRWQGEPADPVELAFASQRFAVGHSVNEALPALDTANARLVTADVAQAGLLGDVRRLGSPGVQSCVKLAVSFAP